MGDVFDRTARSRVMSAIRGTNTAPELIVRKYLHARGLRFRVHVRKLPGRPDIVLSKYRAVVFVHGCFWHQHPSCRFAVMPKTNRAFWKAKLDGNRVRDAHAVANLRRAGWRVFTVWECDLDAKALDRLARRILSRTAETQAR